MKKIKRKIIAIVGPTASGKTGIGVRVAKDFNGEIVSADSRQVYRGLDLGTGKEGTPCGAGGITNCPNCSNQILNPNDSNIKNLRDALRCIENIPQWMIDICEPEEKFTLFDYLPLARLAIEDIFSRGKTPIIVGGTGLYVQALIEGFELKQIQNSKFKTENFGGHSVPGSISRKQLDSYSVEQLQKILFDLDEKCFATLADKKNPHRLIRAIERAQEGLRISKRKPDFEVLQIGITWPKEVLDERINRRVDERFEAGMLEEVSNLIKSGVDPKWLLGLGLEYRIITEFLISNCSNCSNQIPNIQMTNGQINENWKLENEKYENFNAMSETLKLRIRQYAKRQMTWFKRFPDIVWENDYEKIREQIINFQK